MVSTFDFELPKVIWGNKRIVVCFLPRAWVGKRVKREVLPWR